MLARLDSAFAHGQLGSTAQADAAGAASGQGAVVDAAGASVPAAGAQPAEKSRARIVTQEGQPSHLVLSEDFDRSWRSVGVVLDRLDFSIEDRNREQGVYNIIYVDPQRRDKTQGTWSRIFSGERKDLTGQHYQLLVRGEGGETAVSVLLADGKQPSREEDRRVADEIIRILNENLR